jgi:hemoglobin
VERSDDVGRWWLGSKEALQWEAFLDDFQKTLDQFRMPLAEQEGLKAIVESTRKDIVVSASA